MLCIQEQRACDDEGGPLKCFEGVIDELTIRGSVRYEKTEKRTATRVKVVVLEDRVEEVTRDRIAQERGYAHYLVCIPRFS